MSLLHIIVIALVQGITEFLPISSSGHLILISELSNYPDQGLLVDVAVHVATLAAIIVYFYKDVGNLTRGGLASVGIGSAFQERRWFLMIVVGTIPAVIVGLIFKTTGLTDSFRTKDLIGWTLILYGLALFAADRFSPHVRKFEDITWRDAILVGLAQALALVPGTSRSGVTMTAARLLGFTRVESARFSFLLSIPAVAGAGLLVALDLAGADPALRMDALYAGIMTFFVALGAMHFLMKWLARTGMEIFVIYRVALGLGLLLW